MICQIGDLKVRASSDGWRDVLVPGTSTPPELRNLKDPADSAVRWRRWRDRLENYLVARCVEEDSEKMKALRRIGGNELEMIVGRLPKGVRDGTFRGVIKALNKHFDPCANPDRELVTLRRLVQGKEESLCEFFGRIVESTSRCQCVDWTEEARIQLLVGCRSTRLRDMCLRQPGIEIKEILALGHVVEKETECNSWRRPTRGNVGQKEGLGVTGSAHFGKVEKKRPNWEGRDEGTHGCVYCGKDWHPLITCPARGQRCFQCSQTGHFAAPCRDDTRRSRRWNPAQGVEVLLRQGRETTSVELRGVRVRRKSTKGG